MTSSPTGMVQLRLVEATSTDSTSHPSSSTLRHVVVVANPPPTSIVYVSTSGSAAALISQTFRRAFLASFRMIIRTRSLHRPSILISRSNMSSRYSADRLLPIRFRILMTSRIVLRQHMPAKVRTLDCSCCVVPRPFQPPINSIHHTSPRQVWLNIVPPKSRTNHLPTGS